MSISIYAGYTWRAGAFWPWWILTIPQHLCSPTLKQCLARCVWIDTHNEFWTSDLAAGTFERFFSHHASNVEISSLEDNELIVSLAHRYFQLPESQPVIIGTDQEFLEVNAHRCSLLFCEIVNGGTLLWWAFPSTRFSLPGTRWSVRFEFSTWWRKSIDKTVDFGATSLSLAY